MNAKILLTKTPSHEQFKQDMLAAGLAEEVPATNVDGGTEIDVTGTHTTQEAVWVDSNGDPTEPEYDDQGTITNDAQQAPYIYVLTLLTDRAVQVSQYVTFDPDDTAKTYVGDLQAGLAVGQSEVIWDTSQGVDAPGNLSVGWAGYDIETKTL